MVWYCYALHTIIASHSTLIFRSENIILRSERDKSALEANFARERHDSLLKEFEHKVVDDPNNLWFLDVWIGLISCIFLVYLWSDMIFGISEKRIQWLIRKECEFFSTSCRLPTKNAWKFRVTESCWGALSKAIYGG